jgi:hypothetical protein
MTTASSSKRMKRREKKILLKTVSVANDALIKEAV